MKRVLAVPLVAALVAGCAGAHSGSATRHSTTTAAGKRRSDFIAAPESLIVACRSTARAVGYPVPCPMRIPPSLTETGHNGNPSCALHIIGPGGVGGCAKSWRGWVVGSSTTPEQHLVITASPRPMHNYAKVVNGPAWYPKARVKPLGWLTINDWRIRAVFVPPATNDGSAFMHHVVLVWTVGHHTYGVGFHDVSGISRTLSLDKELAEGIRLIGP